MSQSRSSTMYLTRWYSSLWCGGCCQLSSPILEDALHISKRMANVWQRLLRHHMLPPSPGLTTRTSLFTVPGPYSPQTLTSSSPTPPHIPYSLEMRRGCPALTSSPPLSLWQGGTLSPLHLHCRLHHCHFHLVTERGQKVTVAVLILYSSFSAALHRCTCALFFFFKSQRHKIPPIVPYYSVFTGSSWAYFSSFRAHFWVKTLRVLKLFTQGGQAYGTQSGAAVLTFPVSPIFFYRFRYFWRCLRVFFLIHDTVCVHFLLVPVPMCFPVRLTFRCAAIVFSIIK